MRLELAIMAIGERISFFRTLRNMTQKFLGMSVGFPEKSADVRMAQYESGTRTPKADLTNALADVLGVSPKALNIPDIDSNTGLMHTLFALEDLRGLRIGKIDGKLCLFLDKSNPKVYNDMQRMLSAWQTQEERLTSGEITKDAYDQWRYRYPEFDTTQRWVKVPSPEITDAMTKQ